VGSRSLTGCRSWSAAGVSCPKITAIVHPISIARGTAFGAEFPAVLSAAVFPSVPAIDGCFFLSSATDPAPVLAPSAALTLAAMAGMILAAASFSQDGVPVLISSPCPNILASKSSGSSGKEQKSKRTF
jgi:hypothetical protein